MNYSNDYRFIQEVKLKLGYENEKQTELVLKRFFNVLRDQLTAKQDEMLFNSLSHNLKLIYTSGWKMENNMEVTRLDQFVNLLITKELDQPKRIFRSEMDGLKASVVIFSVLDRKYKLSTILPYLLYQDLIHAKSYNEAVWCEDPKQT